MSRVSGTETGLYNVHNIYNLSLPSFLRATCRDPGLQGPSCPATGLVKDVVQLSPEVPGRERGRLTRGYLAVVVRVTTAF